MLSLAIHLLLECGSFGPKGQHSWRVCLQPKSKHLIQLINILQDWLETFRQVRWGQLELNSAWQWSSRTEFGHPCFKVNLYIRGNLYLGPGVSVLQSLAPTSSNKHALKFLVDLDFLDQVYLIKGTLHFLTLG